MRAALTDLLRSVAFRARGILRRGPAVPFSGFTDGRSPTPLVDRLSDDELARLNGILPWNAFTVDGRGRRFGSRAWSGKRVEPQVIPDRRVVLLDERFELADKAVLEIGCFEGIHTIGLAARAERVTAVDARVENVVKTIVRCAFFGHHPRVLACDVEGDSLDPSWLSADVVFHVGVLYHLRDPIRHLLRLAPLIRHGILLDTHFARDEDATETYRSEGAEVRYQRYREWGASDPFSGMYDHAKWLRLDDICATLRKAGFGEVEIVETREERNGPRVLLLGRRR